MKRILVTICIVACVALRLYLTSDRDLLALNQPMDDLWQVRSAAKNIWGGSYSHMTGVHLPVYSAWLWASSAIGLHARLAYDLLWCVSSFALGVAFYRSFGGRLAGMIVTMFMLFHPAGITLADRALAENILPPVVALAIALALEFWRTLDLDIKGPRRWLLGITLAGVCAIAYHTRREGIVLLAPLVVMGVVWLRKAWRPKEWRSLTLGLLVGPVIGIVLFGTVLSALNQLAWGFHARCQLLSPSYNAALQALYRINPSEPNPHYVTVTNETRRAAYAISPTFAELEPIFENQLLPYVKQRDYGVGSPPGEFPDGWFYWDIREAAARAGWHRTAAIAEQKYAAVADEINGAIADGHLEGRPVLLSGLSPEYSRWVPQLPLATWRALKLFLNLSSNRIHLMNRQMIEDAAPSDVHFYYEVAGRRRERGEYATHLVGWLQAPADTLVAVGEELPVQNWTLLTNHHHTQSNSWALDLYLRSNQPPNKLWLQLPDGTDSFLPLNEIVEGRVFNFPNSQHAFGLDRMAVTEFRPRATSYLDASIRYWERASWLALIAGVISILVNIIKGNPHGSLLGLVALLALTALISRCLIVAMIDLAAWPMQYRYIFPALPMLALLLGVGIKTVTARINCFSKTTSLK